MNSTTVERLNAALNGRYAVERELGEGGMATVYLADDLKHERKVALKVLRPELAAVVGADRFLSEIKTTANLQHPHILPLFDSGEADGFLYYVMPHVEGESLRARLDRETQLPVNEAVRIATAVAQALRHAHERGVIHRDIKPANVLLQDGEPVVADFGIALAVGSAGGSRLTETGLSLGTPHYMSPEQATAEKELTARSDVYSLGSVLFEMLTGDPPHTGSSAQQIIMKIVTEPARPVTELRKSAPPNVASALAKALEKLPADRFESAAKFAEALADPSFSTEAGPRRTAAEEPSSRLRQIAVVLAATVVVFVSGLSIGRLGRSTGTDPVGRPPGSFVVASLAASSNAGGYALLVNRVAVSRRGDRFAFLSDDAGRVKRLFLRALDDLMARPLPEDQVGPSVYAPFFSPDGETVGYFAPGGLWTVPFSGGAPRLVATLSSAGVSASWDVDGRIRYTTGGHLRTLHSLDVESGTVDSLTFGLDTTVVRGELLPEDRLLLSLVVGSAMEIVVRDPDGTRRPLLEGHDAHLASTNQLLLSRWEVDEFVLYAVPFEPRTATVLGAPRVLERGTTAMVNAAGTEGGDLVYLAGSPRSDRQIVELDGSGRERPLTGGTGNWWRLRSAPDGHTLIAVSWDGWFRSLWSVDVSTGALVRLTNATETFQPVPGPLGRELFYIDTGSLLRGSIEDPDRGEGWLSRRPLGAEGRPERIPFPGQFYPESVSSDGMWLYGDLSGDIWRVPVGGSAEAAEPVVASPATEDLGFVSPDGRWIAYRSDVSGSFRIMIAPLSDPTNGVQVSPDDGWPQEWDTDGSRLYFSQSVEREIWSVGIEASGPILSSVRRSFLLPPWIALATIAPAGETVFAIRGGPVYTDLVLAQGALLEEAGAQR